MAPQRFATNLHNLSWSERQKQLRTLNTWNVSGSLSTTYNNKTNIAAFEWNNNQDNYSINIHSAMNLVSVKIIGDSKKVVLLQSSGKRAEAASAEELMLHQLGWSLPIKNLNYWIRGLPAPRSAQTTLQFDSYQHLQKMTQQNWQITYASYGVFSGIDLPTKIYLTSPQSQLQAKIVIKQWQGLLTFR